MLMIHTGMLGIVVVTGNRENDVKSVASVLNEIGVGGLNIEIATDNEPYLMDLVEKGLRKSNARPIIGGTSWSTDLRRRVLNV